MLARAEVRAKASPRARALAWECELRACAGRCAVAAGLRRAADSSGWLEAGGGLERRAMRAADSSGSRGDWPRRLLRGCLVIPSLAFRLMRLVWRNLGMVLPNLTVEGEICLE